MFRLAFSKCVSVWSGIKRKLEKEQIDANYTNGVSSIREVLITFLVITSSPEKGEIRRKNLKCVVFAVFHEVNTPTTDDFKLST